MADSPQSTEHGHGPTRVTVDRTDEDRYSVVVGRIRAERTDGALTAPSAGRIAETVDYLGERLRLVETEPDEALVRSSAPVPTEAGKEYYELRFQGDGMTMERRRADGDGTEAVPFVLPKPTLDRLVGDLGHLVGNLVETAAPETPPGFDNDLFSGHKGCC